MLEARKANARVLFDGRQHYEIPVFQRPYVWNKEDQWAPLWDDVVRVAESNIPSGDAKSAASHFLGAVVFEAKKSSSSGVSRLDVIDGQQRLTTLQLLLDAVQEIVSELGYAREAVRLEDLILNPAPEFAGQPERFKLWPSRLDRPAFAHAMDPASPAPMGPSLISDAHAFFKERARGWIAGVPVAPDVIVPGTQDDRVTQLSETLMNRLMLVSIDLSDDEDSQLIFETLNDRGTPLLKADLIKNWVFRRGIELGADVDVWSDTIWDDFDGDWWRDEIAQGRVSRSRIDIFLQYWLTMCTFDEVTSELAFRKFTEYADKRMTDVAAAETFLRELRADADTYRSLDDLGRDTPAGRYRYQVVEAMELAATTPAFLWFISKNHRVPEDQVAIGLGALESWATRRALLRIDNDVNRLMIAVLKELAAVDPARAGDVLRTFLSSQTAESRYWPSDQEMRARMPGQKIYNSLKQSRIRAVLSAVEQYLRSTAKHEQVAVPSGLSIEHVMPREWRTFWNPEPKLDPQAEARRDVLVNSIGNLTLITQSLNSSLRHRPWLDAESVGLKQGGHEGQGKRSLLNTFSLLVLNKQIVDAHPLAWTDDDIEARATQLTEAIIAVWPGPDETRQQIERERS
ncbi:MAG TPA: DUF262 domain-containing HNH endonuclease family protein [Microbacteriaceae bacterium]|nr:DUF262 domain-containing HNH endonuclease family protein [Microbacteriaceae bacterium]